MNRIDRVVIAGLVLVLAVAAIAIGGPALGPKPSRGPSSRPAARPPPPPRRYAARRDGGRRVRQGTDRIGSVRGGRAGPRPRGPRAGHSRFDAGDREQRSVAAVGRSAGDTGPDASTGWLARR